MFRTQYKGGLGKKEIHGGISCTEVAGYVPAKKRIENLMFAGQRLRDFRIDQFDFQDEKSARENGNPIDITRNPGFDLADATMLGRQTKRNLEAQKREAELKASQNASEASEKQSEEKSIPE